MRFVVLHHTGWPGHADHYDLLLQRAAGRGDDDRVLTAFGSLANEFPWELCLLRRRADHAKAYLTFEGPVSGGRGRVQRVDEGECTATAPPAPDMAEVNVQLSGLKLNGLFRLRHVGEGVYSFERTAVQRR